MPKILNPDESFERIIEQGTTQAKKAIKQGTKQLKQTISPTKMWEQLLGTDSDRTSEVNELNKKNSEVKKNGNHTPLDFEKLGKKYKDKESQQTEALKQRLFQLVKSGEEKAILEKKKEEEEKKRKELYELQEKKKKEEEEKKQQQVTEIPKGKVRRSIFSPKKIAQRQHAEVKPASSKQ